TVQSFTTENGLPQNSVKAIVGDNYGFIWMATEAGLLRYDGRHFRQFGYESNNLSGRRFIEIRKSLVDDALYAVADSRELLYMRSGKVAYTGKFLDDLFPRLVQQTDMFNNTWGDIRLNGIPTPDSFQVHLSVKTSVIITQKGVLCWYREGRQVARTQAPEPFRDFSAFFSMNGNLYFVPKDPGKKYVYALGEMASHKMLLTGDMPGRSGGAERILCLNPGNESAFIYSAGNWYRLEIVPGNVFRTTLILTGFDLRENQICSGYYEPEFGRLWLGSKTKGLFVFNKRSFISKKAASGNNFNNVVYEQVPYGDSSVLTGKGMVFSPFNIRLPKPPEMKREAVDYGNTIIKARDNSILSGTLNALYQYAPGSLKPTRQVSFPWRYSWSAGLGASLWMSTYGHGI
ncbi:MAG TPA: two-component regulator propeller domain-containing protein, partial [Chitinophagaceae bacterium]|nr:two-component regulator propeller domain-containing protein [Chitinophagaceae bacterium]